MISAALRAGLDRSRAGLRLLGIVYALNVALALPLAIAVAQQLADAIGPSIAGEQLLRGFDHLWFKGFDARAQGLAGTFEPSVVGIGGVLKALDSLVTATLFDLHPSIVAVGVVYLVAWVFLHAGFLARFVGGEANFLGGAVRHFPRVLTLAAVSWLLYVLVLKTVLSLAADVVEAATYDSADERVHFAWTLAKYGLVWAIVWTISLVFDYAKIAAVARPDELLRRSVRRGLTRVMLHARATYGLSAAVLAIGVGLLLLYAVVAPGADQHNGFKIAIAFAISQTYVFGRVALRCLGIAAQAELSSALEGRSAAARATS